MEWTEKGILFEPYLVYLLLAALTLIAIVGLISLIWLIISTIMDQRAVRVKKLLVDKPKRERKKVKFEFGEDDGSDTADAIEEYLRENTPKP